MSNDEKSRIEVGESDGSQSTKTSKTKPSETTKSDSSKEKELVVPIEINDHYRLFGKEPWEIEYGEECPYCGSRYDEFGYCACGVGGE